MKNVTLRATMILGALVIVFLAIGRYFDSRCEKGCLSVALHDSFEKSGGDFNFSFNSDGDDVPPSEPDGDAAPDLPSFDGLEAVRIKSISTEWIINSTRAESRIYFTNSGLSSANLIKREGNTLTIEIKPPGAKEAELSLPASFKGILTIATVSGEVHIQSDIALKELKVETASGDVDLASWPSDLLELNSISATMLVHAKSGAKAPKTIDLHSVSGDFDVQVPAGFESLSAQTVSGDVRVELARSVLFSYELHSVSGDFEGFPIGGTLKDGFGNKEMTGKFGDPGPVRLHFESVSGDFHLTQSEGFGSR